jgi:hypothetical protein
MKPKKPDGNGDVPQHVLNKARTDETRAREHANITREKKMRLQLAQARGDIVEKDLVTKQAAYLETGKNRGLRRLRIECLLHRWIPMR